MATSEAYTDNKWVYMKSTVNQSDIYVHKNFFFNLS